MGYWEQIGQANIRHRERRARMNPNERVLRDVAGGVLWWGGAIALWVLILAPVALVLREFF